MPESRLHHREIDLYSYRAGERQAKADLRKRIEELEKEVATYKRRIAFIENDDGHEEETNEIWKEWRRLREEVPILRRAYKLLRDEDSSNPCQAMGVFAAANKFVPVDED